MSAAGTATANAQVTVGVKAEVLTSPFLEMWPARKSHIPRIPFLGHWLSEDAFDLACWLIGQEGDHSTAR
jgi:hypothetical protein